MCVCVLYGAAEWEERWIPSTHKSDYGEFKWTAGEFYGDEEKDKGLFNISVCACDLIVILPC